MMARHSRLLARFADQAASLADDLHAAALAADSPEEKRAHHLAFHRMGRALRQTIALEAKLRGDARREERLEAEQADKSAKEAAEARLKARKDRVSAAIEKVIWDEAEDEQQVGYLTLLNQRLDAHDLADPDEPVDALIQRIAAEIGLPVPPPAEEGAAAADPQPDAPGGPPLGSPEQAWATAPPERAQLTFDASG